VRLFDAFGQMMPFAGRGDARINSADRDFFARVMGGEPEPVIGVPIVGRDTGLLVLPFAYKAVPNRFGVAVLAIGVRADLFTRLYGHDWSQTGAAVSLVRSDGVLLARQPPMNALVGTNIFQTLRENGELPKQFDGDFDYHWGESDGERMGASRLIGNAPILVSATISKTAVLAEWRFRVMLALVFGAIATLVLAALVLWIIRLLRLREVETLQLAEAFALASAANNAKTEFMAKMSHELRTPMNAIIGFAETMHEQLFGPLSPRYRDYAGDIHESGLHLLSLINDILDLSRIESGRHELRIEPVAIEHAVTRALTATAPQRRARGIAVTAEGVGSGLLMADERAVHQMLVNLLSNAIKYSPPGGTVRFTACRVDHGIELAVADDGPGIAVADLERVFEPFGRGSSQVARQTEGLGLGLPITKSLIEAHGGRIVLEQVPGSGLRVRLIFPSHGGATADEHARVVTEPAEMA
jgi:two-component system, cell cycle sensor histidine kinase PleC